MKDERSPSQAEKRPAESMLVLDAEMMRGLLEGAPFSVSAYEGADHRVTLSNPKHAEITGGRVVLGKPLVESIPELRGQPVIQMLDDVYRTGEARTVRSIAPTPAPGSVGPRRWFDVTWQPIRDAADRVTGVLVSAVEVTAHILAKEELAATVVREQQARREAEAATGRMRVLAEAATAFAQAKLDMPTLAQAVATALGSSIGGACMFSIVSDDAQWLDPLALHDIEPDAAAFMWRLFAGSRRARVEDGFAGKVVAGGVSIVIPVVDRVAFLAAAMPEFRTIADRFPITSLAGIPLRVGGRVIGVLSAYRRDPERPLTNEDVALLEEIADRAALAVENARLFRRSQEAVSARDSFLSIAGHELKTPLAALQLQIHGLLRHAEKDEKADSGPRLIDRLKKADSQVGRLERLIHDLLDVSRIAGGRLSVQREEIDLATLVHDVAGTFGDEAKRVRSPLVVTVTGPVIGLWDRIRLEQVLTNLVDNALKYGAGKPVHIHLEADAEHARFRVKDAGIGIAPADRARVFERFERAVSERNYGGFGLGLWIVRQVVDAHGGTIEVDSELGAGAAFTVTLPRRPEAKP